jgi:hypothetical protein
MPAFFDEDLGWWSLQDQTLDFAGSFVVERDSQGSVEDFFGLLLGVPPTGGVQPEGEGIVPRCYRMDNVTCGRDELSGQL